MDKRRVGEPVVIQQLTNTYWVVAPWGGVILIIIPVSLQFGFKMDSDGKKVIVCDNGTGVSTFFSILFSNTVMTHYD